ncbi:MAG: DMT family transporter [Leptospirales bacterium]|nr:DMT family transporter [Leptospirales bacterium]
MILNLSEHEVSPSFSLHILQSNFDLPAASRVVQLYARKTDAARSPRTIAVEVDTRNTHNSLIWFGFLGAVGQTLGAVVSRIGYAHAAEVSHSIDGITAALYRNLGGLAVAVVFLLFMRGRTTPMKAAGWPWLFGSALAGPVLGLVAYQQALIDTPGAIVLPIVATSPLMIIPIVWFMEQDRPSLRSLVGGAISVIGVNLLALQRNAN